MTCWRHGWRPTELLHQGSSSSLRAARYFTLIWDICGIYMNPNRFHMNLVKYENLKYRPWDLLRVFEVLDGWYCFKVENLGSRSATDQVLVCLGGTCLEGPAGKNLSPKTSDFKWGVDGRISCMRWWLTRYILMFDTFWVGAGFWLSTIAKRCAGWVAAPTSWWAFDEYNESYLGIITPLYWFCVNVRPPLWWWFLNVAGGQYCKTYVQRDANPAGLGSENAFFQNSRVSKCCHHVLVFSIQPQDGQSFCCTLGGPYWPYWKPMARQPWLQENWVPFHAKPQEPWDSCVFFLKIWITMNNEWWVNDVVLYTVMAVDCNHLTWCITVDWKAESSFVSTQRRPAAGKVAGACHSACFSVHNTSDTSRYKKLESSEQHYLLRFLAKKTAFTMRYNFGDSLKAPSTTVCIRSWFCFLLATNRLNLQDECSRLNCYGKSDEYTQAVSQLQDSVLIRAAAHALCQRDVVLGAEAILNHTMPEDCCCQGRF